MSRSMYKNGWTLKDDSIIKKYYPKIRAAGVQKLLYTKRSACSIKTRAAVIGVHVLKCQWETKQENILKKYYISEGPKGVYKRLQGLKTIIQITKYAFKLKIKKIRGWPISDVSILKKYYPVQGSRYVRKKLCFRYSVTAIASKARKLKIKRRTWSAKQTYVLKRFIKTEGTKGVRKRLKNCGFFVSITTILTRARQLGIDISNRWSKQDLLILKEQYGLLGYRVIPLLSKKRIKAAVRGRVEFYDLFKYPSLSAYLSHCLGINNRSVYISSSKLIGRIKIWKEGAE